MAFLFVCLYVCLNKKDKWLLLAHSSVSHMVGKSQQHELEVVGHISPTVKSRERDSFAHASVQLSLSMLTCLRTSYVHSVCLDHTCSPLSTLQVPQPRLLYAFAS